jgi:hypothetical protein
MPFFRQFVTYLMIAVFFNTAIGVPLHAAEHLKNGGTARQAAWLATAQGAGASAGQSPADAGSSGVVVQDLAQAPDRDAAEPRPDPHAPVESCAVCAAHTHQATAFVIWPMAPPAVPATSSDLPFYVSPAVAAAGQWPFAARDPPRA